MYDTLRTLAGQLLAVPGAPGKLLSEYFSKSVLTILPSSSRDDLVEAWELVDASVLSLLNHPQGVVLELSSTEQPRISLALPLPPEVLTAASQSGDHPAGPFCISPLLLALTALAAGYIEGDRSLRKAARELLKGAQELLLIAACRLCG
jgi:hypothetical protein